MRRENPSPSPSQLNETLRREVESDALEFDDAACFDRYRFQQRPIGWRREKIATGYPLRDTHGLPFRRRIAVTMVFDLTAWRKPESAAGSSAPAIMIGAFVAFGGILFGYDTG